MYSNILYDVVTLYDCMQNPVTLAWLTHLDLPLPGTAPPGRYPTPEEIKLCLESIPGLRISFLISEKAWAAAILSRNDITWASLAVKDFNGDSDNPHHFYFPAGWDEIILIVVSKLVRVCGPLVLLPDSGDLPQLIY
jgi:hypothetical protein